MKTTLVVAALLLNGCYLAEKWSFVRQNEANPVASIDKLYISTPSFRETLIEHKPVDAFRATLSQKQQASFDADLVGFNEYFGTALRKCREDGLFGHIDVQQQPGPGSYVVTIHVESLLLGWWAGLFSGPAKLTYLVEIRDPLGNVVESYRNTSQLNAFSSGERVRFLGASLGGNLSRFIHARQRGLTADHS